LIEGEFSDILRIKFGILIKDNTRDPNKSRAGACYSPRIINGIRSNDVISR